jgi:hypothetical protein
LYICKKIKNNELTNLTVKETYVLEKGEVRFYQYVESAANIEYAGNKYGRYKIMEYIDSPYSYKGKRFFSTRPSNHDIMASKLRLTVKQTEQILNAVNVPKSSRKRIRRKINCVTNGEV